MKRLEQESWWNELVAQKDSFSLKELSEKFGASPAAIANALRRNGITRQSAPGGSRPSKKGPVQTKRAGRRSVLEQYQHQMGQMADREIAELAGVTVSAVTSYRRRHKIEASNSRGRPGNRAAESGPAATVRRSRGYKVVISGEDFVVIASDIAEAAEKARSVGRGEVTQIELLGKALG